MEFPYGLCNAAQAIKCHMARLSSLTPMSDKFVVETIYDRLASDSELTSSYASSKGSHHPS
jgi:hypothetical protein